MDVSNKNTKTFTGRTDNDLPEFSILVKYILAPLETWFCSVNIAEDSLWAISTWSAIVG